MSEVIRQRTVAFPLYQDSTLLDFAGATQVFAFAEGFQPIWLAADLGPILTSENVRVVPEYTFDDHPAIDILFVPGGGPKGVIAAMNDPEYQSFIRKAATTADWYGSVCVGAMILAAADLLEDEEVTTYWSQLENLKLFPGLRVDTRQYSRYLFDVERRRFSGGGVSASIDLAFAIVEHLAGKEKAEMAQLFIQYAPSPPVRAGDPEQASPALVRAARSIQEQEFIEPLRSAIEELLSHRYHRTNEQMR